MKKRPLSELCSVFSEIQASGPGGKKIDLQKAVDFAVKRVSSRRKKHSKVMIVGNGGSASIASHIATDFLKNIKIPALAFNDGSLLTCLGNDLGYENVFSAPINILAEKGDVLFAISSSGRSKNILNAALQAKKKGCFVVTFSGFSGSNPLRGMGDLNFYVPSPSYGIVEVSHLAICHAIVDALYSKRPNG